MITQLFAEYALLEGGWAPDVRLTLEEGRISRVELGAEAGSDDERHRILLPAMPNLHSHAFQRAMAGLSERRSSGNDNFWSWRNIMYRFALSMSPSHVEAIAAQLYVEMLEAGFARVGEFHYLHHDPNGAHYDNIAEMAERIAAASAEAGIGLTLLPVLYSRSGFGGTAPIEGQRRFVNDVDSYAKLLERSRSIARSLSHARVGVAPHSLRAVTPSELANAIELAPRDPIHIHVAEQTREVDECIAWSGSRPISWLLDNAPVDQRWCLVHATHMTEQEALQLAATGAVAGLCPITEANLGDGTFAGDQFLSHGGKFGIGSDSNISISITRELCQLEYSQRLRDRQRNVIANPDGSTGLRLFEEALSGGSRAVGVNGGLREGHLADIVSLQTAEVPYLATDDLLDHWTFADGISIDCVWAMGLKQVSGGRHRLREEVSARFRNAMIELTTKT